MVETVISNIDINKLLIPNDSLFNHVHVINQEFDILPQKKHYGMAINYTDVQERRNDFVRELINTTLDWVYSRSAQDRILRELEQEGRTSGNAVTELQQRAFGKFRKSDNPNLLHGQFGELLLSNCIQRFFEAVPVLRKMPITTSTSHERFGADAIHYKPDDDSNLFFVGEAKSYTSKYQFNSALEASITSIISSWQNITNELHGYVHENFLEKELECIATKLLNGTLHNVHYQLVSIVAYNETNDCTGSTEDEIKTMILKIISDRFASFDKSKIDLNGNNGILKRITYIIFPIWSSMNS